MLYNNNIVLEIIGANFGEDVELETVRSVMDMDGYELMEIFDNAIDFADISSIEETLIHEIDYTEYSEESVIKGILVNRMILEGYVHWDGEDVFVDSKLVDLNYKFSFVIRDSLYHNFEIEYLGRSVN